MEELRRQRRENTDLKAGKPVFVLVAQVPSAGAVQLSVAGPQITDARQGIMERRSRPSRARPIGSRRASGGRLGTAAGWWIGIAVA